MSLRRLATLAFVFSASAHSGNDSLTDRAGRYLAELIRLDTSNPPGRESLVARRLEQITRAEGIPCELLGADPARLNFVARLKSAAPKHRPLLLIAHSDVVPAPPAGWTVPPFSATVRDGFVYGRGALDDKSLLAAELAVLVELKRAGHPLTRDIILLSEADEESGSTGMQWLVRHAWASIDAEFALGEGGFSMNLPSGTNIYLVQTAEKSAMPVLLHASGPGGHGSLPRPDNPLVRLARAVVKLADAPQPVILNPTTRRYLAAISRVPDFAWLVPLTPQLETPEGAAQLRDRDPELDAQLHTTISPDVFRGGTVVNAIPAAAEAQIDVRRAPGDSADAVLDRLRRIVGDPQIRITRAPGHRIPSTPPSRTDTDLYRAMESVLRKSLVVPYLQRGATDAPWLRQKGVPVYGVPLFVQTEPENRAHAVDERISQAAFVDGVRLLRDIVMAVN